MAWTDAEEKAQEITNLLEEKYVTIEEESDKGSNEEVDETHYESK